MLALNKIKTKPSKKDSKRKKMKKLYYPDIDSIKK